MKNLKRAIITGATGALGMALIKELINNNVEVLVIGRASSPRASRLLSFKDIEFIDCDLSEFDTLQNTTGKDWDVFFHFAWMGTTGIQRNDMYLQNNNIKYALDAVGLAKRFGCSTFIGAGSQAEYGRTNEALSSDTPAFPEMGYGIAKLSAGYMTRIYAEQLGLKHIWTRILSLFGPYDTEKSLIMSLISALSDGTTPKCTKGEQIWDYLFSEDAAALYRLIAENPIHGKTYVIGSGKGRPLCEYIKEVRDVVSPTINIDFGAVPYSDRQVMHLVADITDIKNDYKWIPKTEFKDGIIKILNTLNN